MRRGEPAGRRRGEGAGPWWGAHGATGLLAALVMVTVVTACGAIGRRTRPTETPTVVATATTTPMRPTAGATATPRQDTPREETPTPGTPAASPTMLPGSPTAPATAEPAPATPSPSPPTAAVVIHSFGADVDVADPGDTIRLSWQWSGGESAAIYHLFPTGQLSEPSWEVGPTGSLTHTISAERRNTDLFALFVFAGGGVAAQETAVITLRCPDEWFFSEAPDICPAGPALISEGAEQHFEGGTMVWVGAEGRITVLLDDDGSRRWTAYTDEWDEGKPTMDPDIEPPAGLLQPVRGFGLVWREQPGVRERLGWAVDEERGFETAVQRTSHVKYPDLYIRGVDGGVWKLGPNGGWWDYVGERAAP